MTWWQWEFKRTLRNRVFLTASALLCLFVLTAFGYGRSQINKQLQVIDRLERLITESDQVYFQERFKDEEQLGRACYYLSQSTAHKPLPEASLSLGQRDLHSYHQIVRLRTLYAHLFDSGFSNPSQAAAGHFDLAFVLVFLLPLLVISLTFDTLSADAERRTLPLLRVSGLPLGKLVAGRLAVRFLLFGGLTLTLVGLSLMGCGAPLQSLAPWLTVTVAYLLFWFGLAGAVCSLGWSSTRNAGALLGLWTCLTLVGPAVLNLCLPRDAIKSGASITIRARQVVNDGWDIDKEITAKAAVGVDPRYAEAPILQEKFSWSWYYAMHDAGDAAVQEQAADYFRNLEENYRRSLSWSLLFPTVRMQLLLEEFSGTDLLSHLDYYLFVKQSRQDMRDELLPRVFSEETVTKRQLLKLHDELPMKVYEPKRARLWSREVLEFLLLSLLMAATSLILLHGVERSLRG